MMPLNENLAQIGPSATLVSAARLTELKNQGIDVINFTVGEPDFATPDAIKLAGITAITAGCTKYTATLGTPELRQAVAKRLKEDHGFDYAVSEIAVSNGGKHAISNVIYALLNKGDEVLIPQPYWLSYPAMVKLVGGVPKFLPTTAANGYRLQPKDLESAITPRTRILILNSPSNPTGAVYHKEHLAALVPIIKKSGIWVISDEIYAKLLYDGLSFVSMGFFNDIRSQLIIANGVSKTYAMTGWRIGYIAAPKPVVDAVNKIQSHFTSNPSSVSQKAAQEALSGNQDYVETMRLVFQKRRDLCWQLIKDIPGVQCPKPEGAFYLFPQVDAYYGKFYECSEKDTKVTKTITDSTAMSDYLLEMYHVGVVAGGEFGSDANIRLSYATSEKSIEEGCKRIHEGLIRLK